MSQQPAHTFTLVPGPIEYEDAVLAANAHPSISHTAAPFVEAFQAALKRLRVLFFSTDPAAQPFLLAGSGTIGWDLAATNFVEPNEKVLVLNTGYFSTGWADSLRAMDADVTEVKAELGDVPKLADIEAALKAAKYKAVTITHVDTSTGVLMDVKKVAELVHKVSPETLIFVDGVCSIGVEELRFTEWGLDFVLTGPQKGIGAPAGLSISIASPRAIKALETRKSKLHGYFLDLRRWIPIMQAYESGKPAYFSTPAVQTVYALRTALDLLAPSPEHVEQVWKQTSEVSNRVKDTCEQLGMKLLIKDRSVGAHGLSTVFLPDNIQLPEFLGYMLKHNFQLAGGLMQPVATRYFRIGHMGVSALKYGHVDSLLELLPQALKDLN